MSPSQRILCRLLISCLAIAGCGDSRVTRENCDKISQEMTQAEVEAILGPADQSYQGILTWRGASSDQRITIVLDEEHRVSEKSCEGLPAR